LQFKIAIVDDKFEWTDKTASRWESKVSGGKKKFTSDSLELENKRGNFSKGGQKKMNSDIHGSKQFDDSRVGFLWMFHISWIRSMKLKEMP